MTTAIAITGANGFLGRACVAEARRHGLMVLAITRSAPLPEWQDDPDITPVQMDLGADCSWLHANLPADSAIIHAAGHMGGEVQTLKRDTLDATLNLMSCWRRGDIRMVMISSLAVYDTDALTPGDTVTEASPLVPLPDDPWSDPLAVLRSARDPYAGAKRLQEAALLHDQDAEDDWVLRPGAIWGPGRSWHALQGFWASKLFVTIGSDGELPLAHVDHVARAAVEAARTPTEGVGVLNIFDDDRPTRARFLQAHRRCYGWPRLNVTVPYRAWAAMARALGPLSNRLPGLFQPSVLRARMMPLRFPNSRLRQALGGTDHDSFDAMMARSREAEE